MSGKNLLLLFLAGGLGALSRFGLTSLVNQAVGYHFPLGTLAVNVLGCLIFGFYWSTAEHFGLNGPSRIIIMSGFLGAFTTFSSMIFESGALTGYRLLPAALNILAHLLGGFSAFYLGVRTSRMFFG